MNRIFMLVLIELIPMFLWSIPARREPVVMTQPNGSEIVVYPKGDEVFHWIENADGKRLEKDSLGFYRVMPKLTPSEIAKRRKMSRFGMRETRQAPRKAAAARRSPSLIPIILVEFADEDEVTSSRHTKFVTPRDTLDSLYRGKNFHRSYTYINNQDTVLVTASGSVQQYFRDVSMGQYVPEFDVLGPYTLSQKRKYYGGNDSEGNDKNPEEMVIEACQLAQQNAGLDFSKYDSDGDGDIDVAIVIYAGFGEAEGHSLWSDETIWPHQYSLDEWYYHTHGDVKLNGKRLNRYACFNEWSSHAKTYDGIGTFCHEFSHVLGLPDLYVTSDDVAEWKTPGAWDLMDYGPYNNDGNTPPSYSGYERFFMGWGTPTIITDSLIDSLTDSSLSLHELQQSNEFFLLSKTATHNLIGNNPDPTEFYILENRQQKGWDTYLPGHGLLLTKINYSFSLWYTNSVNNDHAGVDIIEASGNYDVNSHYETYKDQFGVRRTRIPADAATDVFPAGATSFNDVSFGFSMDNIMEVEEDEIVVTANLKQIPIAESGNENDTVKNYRAIENGHVFIHKNGKKYSVIGQKIE